MECSDEMGIRGHRIQPPFPCPLQCPHNSHPKAIPTCLGSSVVHLLNKYLLSTYNVPGTVLGTGAIVVNTCAKSLSSQSYCSSGLAETGPNDQTRAQHNEAIALLCFLN